MTFNAHIYIYRITLSIGQKTRVKQGEGFESSSGVLLCVLRGKTGRNTVFACYQGANCGVFNVSL